MPYMASLLSLYLDILRELSPTRKALLANASLQYPRPRSTYRKRRFIAAIGAALLPAAGKLVTLAVEELGGYLQRKRNKALTKALEQLDVRVTLTHNMMHQLEKDFLLFGEYELNSTEVNYKNISKPRQ